jgi:hypothetical protein
MCFRVTNVSFWKTYDFALFRCVIKTYVYFKYICSSRTHMLCFSDVIMFVMLVMCCLNNMCHVFWHIHINSDNVTQCFYTNICMHAKHIVTYNTHDVFFAYTHVKCGTYDMFLCLDVVVLNAYDRLQNWTYIVLSNTCLTDEHVCSPNPHNMLDGLPYVGCVIMCAYRKHDAWFLDEHISLLTLCLPAKNMCHVFR